METALAAAALAGSAVYTKLWPSGIYRLPLGTDQVVSSIPDLSDIYPMFIEPTITWFPSGFSEYIWLDTKIVLKKTARLLNLDGQIICTICYNVLLWSRVVFVGRRIGPNCRGEINFSSLFPPFFANFYIYPHCFSPQIPPCQRYTEIIYIIYTVRPCTKYAVYRPYPTGVIHYKAEVGVRSLPESRISGNMRCGR